MSDKPAEEAEKPKILRRPFKFGTHDIAAATGKTVHAVRKDRERKKFDGKDIKSIAKYILGHVETKGIIIPDDAKPAVRKFLADIAEQIK